MASYGTIAPASPPNPNKLIKHDEEKEELPLKLADENSVKLSIVSMVATLAKLKRKTLADRVVDVTRRMKSNSANLIQYTSRLSESSQQWCPKSLSEEDKLTSRMQKVLCSYSYPSDEIKDDGHYVASSIIYANGSGGKPSRPLKLAAQPNVPPYTTWIYLDRNQRMTEDQSVQGRRRIYYDPVGNETLIASDSEEEEADDEEPKHEFSRGEDFIIWSAVQERGPSALLFEQIEESLHVNRIEVQARYELLQNDVDKQAKCEALDRGFCLQLPSPSGKRKGTKDWDCLIPRASVNGPIVENNATAGENGVTRNLIAEKFEARDLVEAMDSLDNLFCRRCLVFDCRLHGCAQSLVHPSTRQPAASVDTEALRPCGATCYKLSKHAGSDRSNSFVLWEPNAASSAFSADVSERVRVVKRQKIQESETRWIGGKRVSANCNGTSKVHASATALHMSSSHVQVVDVSNKVKSLDKTVRKRSASGYEDASLGLKAEQIGLVSRLTSQKKITRTSKKLSSENSVIFDDSVKYQGRGNPSSKHLGVFKDDGTRAMKKLAEDVNEKLVNGLTKLENLPQKQESKSFSRGGSVTLDHESDTFPITKKKARIGKRPLEENLFTSYESKVHIAQTDGKQSAQDALCPKGWGYLSLPSPKKLAKAIKAPVKDKSSSTEISVDKQTDGKESGQDALCPKGWGYLSLPSPKKLAKAIKAPIRDKSSSAESSVDRQTDDKESGQNALTPNGWGDLSLPLPKKPTKAMKAPGKDKSGSAETSVELEKLKYQGSGVDPYEEKSGITSPTRFVRRTRESGGDELVENGNARTHEMKLDVGESSKEAESASEKSRNSAAKKLARSSRKALAEKVAGAIQQQQMQSKTENPQRSRSGKHRVDEDGSSFSEQSSERGDTVSIRTEEPLQPNLATADKILDGSCSLGLSEGNRAPLDHEGYENGVRAKSADTNADSMTVGGLKVSQSEFSLERMEVKDGWTELEKGLYEKGSEIFGKNSCLIANMTLKGFKTCAEVGEYMAAKEASLHGGELGAYQFPDSLACVLKWGSMDVARARARIYGRKRGSRKLKFTLKSAGQSAIRKRMGNGKDAPCKQFSPCGCLYTCGKQCPCQLSGTCCEKYCGCPKGCKNRFRGCHCAKSQCCSRQCPCFAAGRECDPDVCRNCWIGCGDGKTEGTPQREEKDNYQCHNMKLLLKQRQRVLLSKSDVAGWGAFLRRTVSKHEFLGEYTGELISHREADKRGKIYDRENSSFLFNLNDQYVLDACRKGDKLKFANHSPNPNCYAKVIMVAGDHRVGIFAKERILAGEELFYDYRYEAERAPAWASRGDDSSNGKKEDSVSSERRMKHAS